MSGQAPYMNTDWQERMKRIAEQDSKEKFFEAMGVAAYQYTENIAKENQELKSMTQDLIHENQELRNELEEQKKERLYDKTTIACLMKLLEQNGIQLPGVSSGDAQAALVNTVPTMTYKTEKTVLVNQENGTKDGELALPPVLNTERARMYFKKAIAKKYMRIENGNFIWDGIGEKAHKSQLAYFCGRIFNYKHSDNGNVGDNFPKEELCKLFQEKNLYNLLVQAHSANNKQKWRSPIDEMFDE